MKVISIQKWNERYGKYDYRKPKRRKNWAVAACEQQEHMWNTGLLFSAVHLSHYLEMFTDIGKTSLPLHLNSKKIYIVGYLSETDQITPFIILQQKVFYLWRKCIFKINFKKSCYHIFTQTNSNYLDMTLRFCFSEIPGNISQLQRED